MGTVRDEELAVAELVLSRRLTSKANVESCLEEIRRASASNRSLLPRLADLLCERGFVERARLEETCGGRPPEVAALEDRPGRRVGRYVRTAGLGTGGFGEVWKAWDSELARWVALKFLRPERMDDLDRFRREARTAARLSHPNIAAIYEVAEHERQPFIAMQFVDGETLGPAEPRRVAAWLRDAALAVHAAHELGIVHRDLKPANLMREGERVYVMDFGLARAQRSDASQTASGWMIGTPAYMPPEQARGESKTVDARSDVYSLGATLFELLAGRPPFSGSNALEVVRRVVAEDPPEIRSVAPGVDRELEAVVQACLEKDPSRRYPTARALAEDLDRWLRGEPVQARPMTSWRRLRASLRRHKALAAIAAVAAVLLVASGVGLILQAQRARRSAEALQRLATQWSLVQERKADLRQLRVPADRAAADLRSAVFELDRHVEERPGEPQAWYIRARARLYLLDLTGAEADARESVRAAPEFRPGWMLLGIVHVERYLRESGVSGFEDAAELDRRRSLLKAGLAAIERGISPGGEEAEMARWGLASTIEDRVMARVARALQAAYLDEDEAAAMAVVAEGLRDYRSEEYLRLLGHFASDPAERLARLDEALQAAPGYALAYFYRGMVRFSQGQADAALADYDRALELQPDFIEALQNRVAMKEIRRDFAGSLEDAERGLLLRPDSAGLLSARGVARLRLGDVVGAVSDFDRAIGLRPTFALAWCNRGMARLRRGEPDAAFADFTRAIELKPDFASAFSGRAKARRDRADRTAEPEAERRAGIVDADHALRLNPAFAEALTNRALLRLDLGDGAAALRDLDAAVAADPNFSPAWHDRALLHQRRGELAAALHDIDRALALPGDAVASLRARGDIRHDLGDYEGSLDDLNRAAERSPDLPDIHLSRGRTLQALGRLDEAGSALERALAIEPGFAEAYNSRGLLKVARGRHEEAVADYGRAIDLKPGLAEPWYNRGNARHALGDAEGAVADLSEAIRLRPDFIEAIYNRGAVRMGREDLDGALADFDRVIAIRDVLAVARYNRGSIKRQLNDLAGAVADYTRAVELAPTDVEMRYELGLTRMMAGRPREAIPDFDRALEIDPAYVDAALLRAMARVSLGDDLASRGASDAARREWERAREDVRYALGRGAPDWNRRGRAEQLLRTVDAKLR